MSEGWVSPVVLGLDGREHVLTDLWKHRRVVLCFTRHFGCRFCKQQIAGLNRIFEELKANDVALLAISVGASVLQGQAFKKATSFQGELYIDPDATAPTSYNVFQLLSGPGTLRPAFDDPRGGAGPLGLRQEVFELGETAMAEGFEDDVLDYSKVSSEQLQRIGGIFVLGPGMVCDFSHRSQFAGDHAKLRQVLTQATGRDEAGSDFIYEAAEQWVKNHKMDQRHDETSLDDPAQPAQSPDDSDRRRTHAAMLLGLLALVLAVAAQRLWSRGTFPVLSPRLVVLLAGFFCALGWCVRALRGQLVPNEMHTDNSKSVTNSGDGAEVAVYPVTQVDSMACEANVMCDCAFVQTIDFSSSVDTSARGCAKSAGDEVPLSANSVGIMSDTVCYLRDFCCKAHPLVGRPGPVCPFLPKALKLDSVYLGVLRTDGPTSALSVQSCMRSFVSRFGLLNPTSTRREVYKAVIIVFPDVPLSHAARTIDQVQARLKPLFVAEGLMIGEFHKINNACGLRNPHFYPLRTPHPALAIRKIVPTDLPFLSMERYPPSLRVQFLTSYLQQFADDPSPAAKKAVFDATTLLGEARSAGEGRSTTVGS